MRKKSNKVFFIYFFLQNSEKKREKQIKKTHLKAKDMFLISKWFFIDKVHGGGKFALRGN